MPPGIGDASAHGVEEVCAVRKTGHLVLTTMHTRDTRGAITRLVDMFPADRSKELCSQLSFALTMVVGQKLVANADGGGRRVAMEVLKNQPAMGHLIRSGKWEQIYATIETHRASGMLTLERHLIDAKSGQLRPHVLCVVNGAALLREEVADARLADGDEILIHQAISGG